MSQGCVTRFDETHYFRTVDANGKPVNYFKIEIGGGTFLSSSRYLSGYFDEQAVNSYFGDFTQPAGFPPASATTRPSDGSSIHTQSLDGPNLEGKKLTLLFSSNSDAIATQIGSLGQGNDVATTLSQLFAAQQHTGQQRQQLKAKRDAATAAEVVTQGTSAIGGLPADGDPAKSVPAVLSYANTLAAYLGNKVPFTDLAAAKKWIETNGVRVAGEDK